MPLFDGLVPTWLVTAVFATIVVRLLAIGLRDRPSTYARVWYCGLFILSAASILLVLYVASVPLFSERRGGGDPGALPTPGELLSALVSVLGFGAVCITAVPALFALGLSPPRYYESRRNWWIGLVPIVAAVVIGSSLLALNWRYISDYRATTARRTAVQASLSAWLSPGPSDPAIGPVRHGEWAYLGAIPTYAAGPGSDLVGLEFVPLNRSLRRETLPWVAKQVTLESLRLDCEFADDDVVWLKPLRALKKLRLHNTSITDKGVADLASLSSLEDLELIGAPITAESLDSFAQLQSLKSVNLIGTSVTHEELRSFTLNNPEWRLARRFLGLERVR